MFDLSRILSSRNAVERVSVEEKSPQKRLHEETEGKKTPRKSKMVKSVWNVLESSDISSLSNEEIETYRFGSSFYISDFSTQRIRCFSSFSRSSFMSLSALFASCLVPQSQTSCTSRPSRAERSYSKRDLPLILLFRSASFPVSRRIVPITS